MGDNNRNNNNPNQYRHPRTNQHNRPSVNELKQLASRHPTGLTNNLLRLFEARPPLEFKAPPQKKKCPPYTGMAQFVSNFAEKGDPEYQPPVEKCETPSQKKARIHKLRLEEGARKVEEELQKYDPHHNQDATGDPYKTLFVSKLNYDTTERKIKSEFEAYGPIKQYFEQLVYLAANISLSSTLAVCDDWATCLGELCTFKVRLVTDSSTSKSRGYAFIEYKHKRDMIAAYKQSDGKKIDGTRVLVDVERGRTVQNWRPRRLGGGLGTGRIGAADSNLNHSRREMEKPRDMSRERERQGEKSHERSLDRSRDYDHRQRGDRSRARDDEVREREIRRNHDQAWDHGRDRGRNRDNPRKREREYGYGDLDYRKNHSRDRDCDHLETKHNHDNENQEYFQGQGQYGDLVNKCDEDRYGHRDPARAHY